MSSVPSPPRYEVIGIEGIPEVRPGDDIARLIVEATARQSTPFAGGDLLVVGQKIVSKAEGRIVRLADVTPSPVALAMAAGLGRDPRLVEIILRESRRVVRMDQGVLITETHHGWVCANAASTSPMWISIASRSSPRIRTAQRARCATGSAPSPAPMSA